MGSRRGPRVRWERMPIIQGANAPLSPAMKLLIGHLGGKPWGQPARTAATWRALAERGLTTLVDGRPPHTELTGPGQRVLAVLDARMAAGNG